jgi:glycerophosphoryl diester phosphodiesterase
VLTAERLHRPLDYVRALDADAFHPSCTADADVLRRGIAPEPLDTALIAELTGAGIMVNTWTENSEARMRVLLDAGVTGIFSDYPNRLARVLVSTGYDTSSRPTLRRSQKR